MNQGHLDTNNKKENNMKTKESHHSSFSSADEASKNVFKKFRFIWDKNKSILPGVEPGIF